MFECPIKIQDFHGEPLLKPEIWRGCPSCYGGTYKQAIKCDICGEYITDKYIKFEDKHICENCYVERSMFD